MFVAEKDATTFGDLPDWLVFEVKYAIIPLNSGFVLLKIIYFFFCLFTYITTTIFCSWYTLLIVISLTF